MFYQGNPLAKVDKHYLVMFLLLPSSDSFSFDFTNSLLASSHGFGVGPAGIFYDCFALFSNSFKLDVLHHTFRLSWIMLHGT